jgi:hypothetical protein
VNTSRWRIPSRHSGVPSAITNSTRVSERRSTRHSRR